MKIINKPKDSHFDYQVELVDFYEHPACPSKTKDAVIDRMEISYSKETTNFYFSGYYANPTDSYGANWEITDSGCISLIPEELDTLIIELQKAQSFIKENI